MPYKSDAQRRWAHTESAKKADFPTDEFDKASKGKKLPEHAPKLAEGGPVVTDQSQGDEFTDGIKSGMNHDMDTVKDYLMNLFGGKDQVMNGNPALSPTLPGLQNIADKAAGIPQPEQGYANGGVVDQDFFNKLQNGTALTQAPPQFDPKAGLPLPPPMPVQQPQQAIPQPNPLNQYLNTQRAKINQYGPEQQMQVSNNILNQQNGLRGRLANAGTGLADALMQGVARAGSSNFQSNLQNRQNQQASTQMEALKGAREANMQQAEAGQKLDAMDPNSPVSKVAQQTWGALLSKNGFKPDQIAQMPASSIAALTGQTVEALKAAAEAKMAEATLGLKTQQAGEEIRHNKEAEGVAKGNLEAKNLEDKRNALKETASHYLLHPGNAFKASGELGNMGLGEDTNMPAAPVTPFSDPDKEARYQAWKASQGK